MVLLLSVTCPRAGPLGGHLLMLWLPGGGEASIWSWWEEGALLSPRFTEWWILPTEEVGPCPRDPRSLKYFPAGSLHERHVNRCLGG